MLSPEELSRYSRNILLDEVRRSGQERLKQSTVTIVGAGGLGSPALLYLAAAGVGNIRVVDSDTLDTTNLQRQVLYKHSDIGSGKAFSAAKNATELNPFIRIESIPLRIDRENASDILKNSDLVLEGSDNFETKFCVNDACINERIPLITAGILRFEGMVFGIRPGADACFRCVYESSPAVEDIPTCADAGVIGGMAGIIGSIQATEAIQFLLDPNRSQTGVFGKILQLNAKTMDFRSVVVNKRTDCEICGSVQAKNFPN